MAVRRCCSSSDLLRLQHSTDIFEVSCSTDAYEDLKPIKRSRSDQSLSATAQLAAACTTPESSFTAAQHVGYGGSPQTYNSLAQRNSFALAGQFGKVHHVPSLPVVLSDVGSSTNSLLSLDSEAARSVGSTSHLVELLHCPAAPAAAGTTAASSPSSAEAAAAALSSSEVTLLRNINKRSCGALYSLNNVSSAASLSQAQLTATYALKLDRSASDTSLSSASGSYLAALQQLVPPLPAYSPPPLFSPGPPSLPGQGSGNISPAQFGFGFRGGSILQQKAAGFAPPAAAGAITGGGWGSGHAYGVAPVSSMDSTDSISSVEVGEHLVRFGGRSLAAAGAGAGAALDGGRNMESTAAETGSPGQQQQQQQVPGGTPSPAATSNSISTAASPLPPPGPSARMGLPKGGSSGNLAARAASAAANSKLGGTSSPSRLSSSSAAASSGQQQASSPLAPQHKQRMPSPVDATSSQLERAPTVEVQRAGSMLGNEGEQWLLQEESTGAIGTFSPSSRSTKPQAADAGAAGAAGAPAVPSSSALSAACNPAAELSAAAAAAAGAAASAAANAVAKGSVSVSHALPSCSTTAALPAPTSASFGFGAAAAAAAAKLKLFNTSGGAVGAAAGAAASQAFAMQATGALPGCTTMASAFAQSSSVMQHQQHQPQAVNSARQGAFGQSQELSRAPQPDIWSAPLPALQAPTPAGSDKTGSYTNGGANSGSMYYEQAGVQKQLHQQQHEGIARNAASHPWSFARRPASFDCARPSLGSRRRGSLELNMPWRSRLDAVIAQVSAEPEEVTPGSPQSAQSSITDMSAGSGHSPARLMSDPSACIEPFTVDAGDPFGSGGASELSVTAAGPQRWQQRGSALDLLLPLQELEDGPCVNLADLGAGSRQQQQRSRHSSGSADDDTRSSSSRSTSSSGASVAADHDLPGSTNLGGYIEASLGLGAGGVGAAEVGMSGQHYGLEFDGAMVMQSRESSEMLQLQQQQGEGQQVSHSHRRGHGHWRLSPEHEKELARIGSPPIESRLRHSVANSQHHHHNHSQQQQHAGAAEQAAASSGMSASSTQQQQQLHAEHQVVVVEVDEEDEEAHHLEAADGSAREEGASAAAAIGSASQQPGVSSLATASSISSSISSISSRGASGSFYTRRGAGSGSTGAAYELFVRLNRARQTLDFAKRQAQAFAELDCAELGVWEALDLLNTLREYEAVLLAGSSGSTRSSSAGGGPARGSVDGGGDGVGGLQLPALLSQGSLTEEPLTPDMPLKEHALQVAELCRLSFPDKPWMALVGLLHGLGKLLAHPMWGSQPQWAVAGESYPVGCRFAPQISNSEFFSANPDRRRRTYSTALGVYGAGCGLRNVYMSWGAPEYLYMLLVLNQTQLPEEALFMLRYQRCTAITKPGGAYRQLMSESDKTLLPLLAAFQGLIAYRKVQLPPEALKGQELVDYYNQLIAAYLGEEKLFW